MSVDSEADAVFVSQPADDASDKPETRLPFLSVRSALAVKVAGITALWPVPNYTIL